MAVKCSCGSNNCGKQAPVPYNGAGNEPATPTTKRGIRRKENKKK
jgi:hypothetical protein